MKEAGRDTTFVFDEGTFVGAFLAPSFCAEHECGLERLQSLFGIQRQSDEFGMEYRRARAVEGHNIVFEKRKTKGITRSILYADGPVCIEWFKEQNLNKPKKPIKDVAHSLSCYTHIEDSLTGSWDNSSFALYAPTEELTNHLEELYQAFLRDDAIIMYGGGNDGNPFNKPGLALGIISRMPEVVKQQMYAADEDRYNLKQAAKNTGIYDIVSKDSYFALSPYWLGENSAKKTEHPIIFWLNPFDQESNACGYFTVEELTAWAKKEALDGPIAGRGNRWRQQQRAKKIVSGKITELFSDEICCHKCVLIINVGHRGPAEDTTCPECGSRENLIFPKPIRLF